MISEIKRSNVVFVEIICAKRNTLLFKFKEKSCHKVSIALNVAKYKTISDNCMDLTTFVCSQIYPYAYIAFVEKYMGFRGNTEVKDENNCVRKQLPSYN